MASTVLRDLGGNWLECQDQQGLFYYNSVTKQSQDTPPVVQHQVAAPAPTFPPAQPKLKQTLGDWQICEDAQGEFYVHTPTGQSYDQPPQALVQLHQASQQVQSVPAVQSVQAVQPAQVLAQQQQATQATLKMSVGPWQVWRDAMGEFYKNTTTGQEFEQPPAELVRLLQAAKVQQAQSPQAQAYPQHVRTAAPQAYVQQAQPMQVQQQQVHPGQYYSYR